MRSCLMRGAMVRPPVPTGVWCARPFSPSSTPPPPAQRATELRGSEDPPVTRAKHAALRMLGRRAYSEKELHSKLAEKGHLMTHVLEAVEALQRVVREGERGAAHSSPAPSPRLIKRALSACRDFKATRSLPSSFPGTSGTPHDGLRIVSRKCERKGGFGLEGA